MRTSYECSTDPTVEPVTWAEMKFQLNIDDDADQTDVERMIEAARIYFEDRTGRALISQTWKLYLEKFPSEIELPVNPVQTTGLSIKYIDTAGDVQTWSSDEYQVDDKAEPAQIKPVYGYTWPTVQYETYKAVTVEWIAGHGDAATDVPDTAKQAIHLLTAHLYTYREPAVVGTISSMVKFLADADAAEALIRQMTIADAINE